MRASERGQITIPKNLRERLGLVHNVEVDIRPTDDGILIHRKDAGQPEKESAERHRSEPFNLEKLLNDPNPRTFDPDKRGTLPESGTCNRQARRNRRLAVQSGRPATNAP